MREVSKDLGNFQVSLSAGHAARVTPKIATEVFSSLVYLEDTNATALSGKAGVTRTSMASYCTPNKFKTPNFNKFVHMLDRLGYDVILKKRNT